MQDEPVTMRPGQNVIAGDGIHLICVEGAESPGQTYELPEGVTIVGRGSTADLRVGDSYVSREHLKLTRTGASVVAENLSRYGCSIEKQPMQDPILLLSGQRISLSADTMLCYRVETAQTPPQPPPPEVADGTLRHPSLATIRSGRRALSGTASGGQSPEVTPPAAPRQPKAATAWRWPRGWGGAWIAHLAGHIWALALTVAVLLTARGGLPETAYLRRFLLERSACQWLSLYAFAFGVVCLVRRWSHWIREKSALAAAKGGARPEAGSGTVWRRCHRLEYYATRMPPGELRALAGDLAGHDRDVLASGYAPVQDVIQMLPMIGFFGTVLGLSLGLYTTFSAAGGATGDTSFAAAIATAFDTTLLALACTIALTVLQRLIHRQEADLLHALDTHVESWVEDRLPEQSSGTAPVAAEAAALSTEARAVVEAVCRTVAEQAAAALADQTRVAKSQFEAQAEAFRSAVSRMDDALARTVDSFGAGLLAQADRIAAHLAEAEAARSSGSTAQIATLHQALCPAVDALTAAIRDTGRINQQTTAAVAEGVRAIQTQIAALPAVNGNEVALAIRELRELVATFVQQAESLLRQPRRLRIVEEPASDG